MSILLGNKEEMTKRYKENCKLAKEALTYISEIITNAKEENKEVNIKLKEKLDEQTKRQLLFIRYDNAYIIRNLKFLIKDLSEVQYTGVTPYELIEKLTNTGRITVLTEHYEALATILNKMEYFPEDYYG